MDNKKQQQKKKKNGSGIIGIVIVLVIWVLNRVDFRSLFYRLRFLFRTGRLPMDEKMIVAVFAGALVIVILGALVIRAAKAAKQRRFDGVRSARGGGTAANHTHDRLQGYRGDENNAEHWKKQLDGFLAAGIIDRSEYHVLLERRRK